MSAVAAPALRNRTHGKLRQVCATAFLATSNRLYAGRHNDKPQSLWRGETLRCRLSRKGARVVNETFSPPPLRARDWGEGSTQRAAGTEGRLWRWPQRADLFTELATRAGLRISPPSEGASKTLTRPAPAGESAGSGPPSPQGRGVGVQDFSRHCVCATREDTSLLRRIASRSRRTRQTAPRLRHPRHAAESLERETLRYR